MGLAELTNAGSLIAEEMVDVFHPRLVSTERSGSAAYSKPNTSKRTEWVSSYTRHRLR